MKFKYYCFLLLFTASLYSQAQRGNATPVIFDSDMGPDYDDVGAIAMLHAYADSGYLKMLATVASTRYEGVAGVLNVFNTYFKRPNIPIGVVSANGLDIRDFQHWSDTLLVKYPHTIQRNEEVPDAVQVYRKVLAAQKDHSVTIITVGFFTNLANLLRSGPDQYSSLSGEQLVAKKVKQLISMAGMFPSGREFNIHKDAASARYVLSSIKVPVIFTGFEIGKKIKVGLPLIRNQEIKNSPVQDVFRISIPQAKEDSAGRMSWDETAVLVAAKGWQPFYTLKRGHIIVEEDGSNSWNNNGTLQAYLVEKVSPETVQAVINKVIMHQPRKDL